MSRPESVSSSRARAGFQDGHLQDFVALLLAAGEAFVDGAADEFGVDLDLLDLLVEEALELAGGEFFFAVVDAAGVDTGLEELPGADAG